MKPNKFFTDILTIGFALFSMFFGAGNVIFPPYLGLQSGRLWFGGFSAYYIADVLLAVFALFALLQVGSSKRLMERLGKKAAVVLMTVIILCIGPLLAIPRTAATTYELGIGELLPSVSPLLFSVLFFALILALSIQESSVIDIIGKFLTPALLLAVAPQDAACQCGHGLDPSLCSLRCRRVAVPAAVAGACRRLNTDDEYSPDFTSRFYVNLFVPGRSKPWYLQANANIAW